jgi:hypothetical protein
MSEVERDAAWDDSGVGGLLGNLPALRVDESWHDHVLRAGMYDQRRATLKRWSAAGIAGLAVITSVFVMRSSHGVSELALDVTIQHGDGGATRGVEAMVGDHIFVRARAEADSDLRVFRNGILLLANCPGVANCVISNGSEKVLNVRIAVPGEYEVILAGGAQLAPAGASMDRFLAAARSKDVRVRKHLIDVR